MILYMIASEWGLNVEVSGQPFSKWVKEPDVNILGVPSRDAKVVT